jgi:TRAP-type C4-dicarboxylate transport system permease small subunit
MYPSRTHVLLERLRLAQLRLAAVALIVMMAVTLADVFLRYVFNHPVRGSYDLVESMMIVFVFNGMSTAFLQRRSIVIDLVDNFAPRLIVTALIRISDLLAVATLLLFSYAMITPALQAYAYGDRKMELGLPLWALWTVALIGMACAILCALGALLLPATVRHNELVE